MIEEERARLAAAKQEILFDILVENYQAASEKLEELRFSLLPAESLRLRSSLLNVLAACVE